MDPITQQTVLACAGASGGAGDATYVDDVFSTFLYDGNGSTSHSINNGIDLSNEGGMVWFGRRDDSAYKPLFDTERGATKALYSNDTLSEDTASTDLTAFNSNGFTVAQGATVNANNGDYVSWSFRKAPGFFDIVTYTGDGSSSANTISHSLGSTPGTIIVKGTNTTDPWIVWHRSLTSGNNLRLNDTRAQEAGNNFGNSYVAPTDSAFTVSNNYTNASGKSYVAYIFAHDDQSFGDNSDEAVIKCGSVTTNSSGKASIDLGFEPQWVLLKRTSGALDWYLWDTMRGIATGGTDQYLQVNTNAAEASANNIAVTSTGFDLESALASENWVYVAIRRPHKPPTDGDDVLKLNTRSGTGSNATITGIGFAPDAVLTKTRSGTTANGFFYDRLRGNYKGLYPDANFSEGTSSTGWELTGVTQETADIVHTNGINRSGNTFIDYFFRRAPGFFDVVAYTGNGTTSRNVSHNLGVFPELVIIKRRSSSGDWWVDADGAGSGKVMYLNNDNAAFSYAAFGTHTATTIQLETAANNDTNQNNGDYIAYLFATLDGISKVGTYSGTGSDVDVDCGFTSGARFVLVKRTDSSGHWYVWDTARGIVSGNDPYLTLNQTSAEATGNDFIDPLNSGFTITSSAPTNMNASGGTYLFLAIA